MTPMIMHVDIDAFFASVEQVCNPKLRGKPVIVGSGVIASCSYEARRHGLRAGMPLYRAKKLCPGAVILEGHCPTYRCFSERVFEICRRMAPGVETYLDEAYCDLTGTDGIYGHPLETGRRLKQAVRDETGLSVSVGIAANRMVAKMAGGSSRPDGLTLVEPGREQEFIVPLPVEKLPGVGHVTREVLRKLNIATVGDLRRLSRESLRGMFGPNGAALYERCRGRDTRVVSEQEIPRSISRETTFHQETIDLKEIQAMLYYLTERAAGTLRRLGLKCGRVGEHLHYSDHEDAAAIQALARPTSFDRDLFAAALRLLERLLTRRVSLRRVGVTLSHFSLAGRRQAELFDEGENVRLGNLYGCLDELRDRYGYSAIVAGKSVGLLGKLRRNSYGYVLRTPCLTK